MLLPPITYQTNNHHLTSDEKNTGEDQLRKPETAATAQPVWLCRRACGAETNQPLEKKRNQNFDFFKKKQLAGGAAGWRAQHAQYTRRTHEGAASSHKHKRRYTVHTIICNKTLTFCVAWCGVRVVVARVRVVESSKVRFIFHAQF